jgi:hypothetical protein
MDFHHLLFALVHQSLEFQLSSMSSKIATKIAFGMFRDGPAVPQRGLVMVPKWHS